MALTSRILGALLQVNSRANEGGVLEIVPGSRLLIDAIVDEVEDGALLDEIATAVAEAQAARDEAVDISGISTSDAVIASRITTPGTATEAALSATYAPVPQWGRLADLSPNAIAAHRGGGGPAPESTMAAFRTAVDAGAEVLEFDVQKTADGQFVVMHDSTLDRTTNGTGAVSASTTSAIRALSASDYFPWPRVARVPTLDEMIAEFGGRVHMMVEPKDTSELGEVLDIFTARGLKGCASFAARDLTDLALIKGEGHAASFIWTAGPTNPTPAVAASNGADALVLNGLTRSEAEVSSLVATGLPTFVYTINRRYDRDRLRALGAKIMTDEPAYMLASTPSQRTVDSWRTGTYGNGLLVHNQDTITDRGALAVVAGKLQNTSTSSPSAITNVGEVSPVANAAGTYSITVSASFLTLPASTNASLRVFFGLFDDRTQKTDVDYKPGYQLYLNRSGSLRLYRQELGATGTQLGASIATGSFGAGVTVTVRIDVTPATVNVTRLDTNNVAHTTGPQADATYRGGYIQIGKSSSPDATMETFNLTIA